VAVVGGCTFDNINLMHSVLDIHLPSDAIIVSGGAKGTDRLAQQYAEDYQIPFEVILPDWKRSGSRAPMLRNLKIVHSVEIVVAFWDGQSKGTLFTINETRSAGKKLVLVQYGNLVNKLVY
jgi:hypothetical protein